MTGQFETSRKSYDIAIGVLSQLRDEDPSEVEYAGLRRRTKSGGSLFLMNGKSLEAERDLQKAIVESERFLTQPMKPDSSPCSKSAALIDLAEIQILKKDGEAVRRLSDQAVVLLGPLADVTVLAEKTLFDRWLISLARLTEA